MHLLMLINGSAGRHAAPPETSPNARKGAKKGIIFRLQHLSFYIKIVQIAFIIGAGETNR